MEETGHNGKENKSLITGRRAEKKKKRSDYEMKQKNKWKKEEDKKRGKKTKNALP